VTENGSLEEGDEAPLAALLGSVAGRLESFIAVFDSTVVTLSPSLPPVDRQKVQLASPSPDSTPVRPLTVSGYVDRT
jgi:hypothetical protein